MVFMAWMVFSPINSDRNWNSSFAGEFKKEISFAEMSKLHLPGVEEFFVLCQRIIGWSENSGLFINRLFTE